MGKIQYYKVLEDEKRRKYVVIFDSKLTKEQAIRRANNHFKAKLDNLTASKWWVDGNNLYVGKPGDNGMKVWAVYRKGR